MSELAEVQQRVQWLVDRARYGDARRELARGFELDPDDPQSHLLAASIAYREDDYPRALQHLGSVLARAPDDVEARVLLFRVQVETRQFIEAEPTVLALLRELPEEGHLYALYAHLMLQTLHLDKAAELVREALRLDPADQLALTLDVMLRAVDGRSEEALERLAELVRTDPEASHVAWTTALALSQSHRNREALEVTRGILRANPADADAVDVLVQLRAATHWSMIPLWPVLRFGWYGSAALWAVAVISLHLVARFASPSASLGAAVVFLAYVLYSWLYPPLLKRWLRARGF